MFIGSLNDIGELVVLFCLKATWKLSSYWEPLDLNKRKPIAMWTQLQNSKAFQNILFFLLVILILQQLQNVTVQGVWALWRVLGFVFFFFLVESFNIYTRILKVWRFFSLNRFPGGVGGNLCFLFANIHCRRRYVTVRIMCNYVVTIKLTSWD